MSWHRLFLPGSIQAYLFATLCVALAGCLHFGLGLISEDSQVFTTFYPAVLFAALLGGVGAGHVCGCLERLSCVVGVHDPTYDFFATNIWTSRKRVPKGDI